MDKHLLKSYQHLTVIRYTDGHTVKTKDHFFIRSEMYSHANCFLLYIFLTIMFSPFKHIYFTPICNFW